MAFRELKLPAGIAGRVYLHSMPGRARPFDLDRAEAERLRITAVVRLTSNHETEDRSPEYMDALRRGLIGWEDLHLPIPDYGIPGDMADFRLLLEGLLTRLREGERILIHCAAGIGRTGTMAAALLVGLGLDIEEAVRRVGAAGSHAEDLSQINFLRMIAGSGNAP